LAKVGIALAFMVLLESLLLLYLGSQYFSIFANHQSLNTFTFELLFFFSTFSIIIVRERGHFWESIPSKFLTGALIFEVVAAIALSIIGLPGLKPLPIEETIFVLFFTLVCSLSINDLAKVYLLRFFKVAE
jgi:H+-transporting ATPase